MPCSRMVSAIWNSASPILTYFFANLFIAIAQPSLFEATIMGFPCSHGCMDSSQEQ